MTEKVYDEVIAPKIKALADECKAAGMSFIANVEFAPGQTGTTANFAPDCALAMMMVWFCARTAPNIDAYIMTLLRYCREQGIATDSSIVAHKMGDTTVH